MDSISSISKGVFVFKNGPKIKDVLRKEKQVLANKENDNDMNYLAYKNMWIKTEERIEEIQSKNYNVVLSSLLEFIRKIQFNNAGHLKTVLLLTGINQIDHLKQFKLVSKQIENNVPSIVSVLQSRNCPSVKHAVEFLVNEFINQYDKKTVTKLKRNQLSMCMLQSWYLEEFQASNERPKLIIIMTDFEQFNKTIVQDLINILCFYASNLPFILILGIATAFKSVQNILPSEITNKMDINIFENESSTDMLNRIIDKTILSYRSPFHLSGKSFKVLMDIFLFYDYSLLSFIQGYKIFMLEHFCFSNFGSIIYKFHDENIDKWTHDECETIRRSCFSFRKFAEARKIQEDRVNFLLNDEFFKRKMGKRISKITFFWYFFYCHLKILSILFEDLPQHELGKLPRELYPICITNDITKLDEYKEMFKLLKFVSKEKILIKLEMIIEVIEYFVQDTQQEELRTKMRQLKEPFVYFYKNIEESGINTITNTPASTHERFELKKKGASGRQEMMEKLKEMAKHNIAPVVTKYEQALWECIDYINRKMEKYLRPLQEAPFFYELTVFCNYYSIRKQIMGIPRGALHQALSNPHIYMQCSCCKIPEQERILPSLPDISIVYKLHLECNKFISLYDWLQSFATIIEYNEDEDHISPEVQARFTRSIAELQFLGFIKQSKHKTDTAARLTW